MSYRFSLSRFHTLGYILFFFTIVDNRYMVYTPVLFAIYTLRSIYAARGFYLIFKNLKATGRTSHSRLLFLQLLFFLAIIFSGVLNRNITPGIIFSVFIWIGISGYVLNSGIVNQAFIRATDVIFKLIVTATLALAAIAPNITITNSYDGSRVIEGFFGGKNALPIYLLMGLCLNLLVSEMDNERRFWRRYLYPIICTVLLSVSGSGTGLVIGVVFLVLFYTGLYRSLNVYNTVIIHTVVFFSIVVYRLQERYLYPLIVNVLHRDITLTYRTDIWTIAIGYFRNGWLVGYGLGNEAIAQNLVLPSWYQQTINETHNGILDIALSLGIMGLIPFLLLIIFIIKEYDGSENRQVPQIMKLYVFVYFVIAISESAFTLSRLTFWSMLFIGLAALNKYPEKVKLVT